MVIYAINAPDAKHLEKVKAEMAILGAPTIRVIDCGEDQYKAIEGSHRLAAANELGIAPNFEIIDADDDVDFDALDIDTNWFEGIIKAHELAAWLDDYTQIYEF